MAYFRKPPRLGNLLEQFSRSERWLICINADPDAMASAMALRRIMIRRVADVDIASINEVTRPDNLAMIRYTRLHMLRFEPGMREEYQRFAVVDSQPHHSELFASLPFSVIIDHHPLPQEPAQAAYRDIRPDYAATSTMLIEYLYNLGIRPGKLLATALQYGIKSDTGNFERKVTEVDIRAYHYLVRYADQALLYRIARSEFHSRWLDDFAKACVNLHTAGSGQFVFMGEVENPDILVIIADFFMRVYEFRWVAVSGLYRSTVVVIFRGDGILKDLGGMASAIFGDIGSAGGHKTMARAEFPVAAAAEEDPELFVFKRVLAGSHWRPSPQRQEACIPLGEELEADGDPTIPDPMLDTTVEAGGAPADDPAGSGVQCIGASDTAEPENGRSAADDTRIVKPRAGDDVA